jgi:hypothetical protein
MNGTINFRRAALILVLAAMLQACVPSKRLATSAAFISDVQGTYTLLLYGCHYPDQISNIAILVDEASKYPVEIYDLDTSYKVKKGVPPQQALAEADSFVRCTTHRIWQTQLLRILDDTGGTIGYEVRPLYIPYEFGIPDVLLVNYFLRNGVVRVYIKIDPVVERAIESSGDGRKPLNNK